MDRHDEDNPTQFTQMTSLLSRAAFFARPPISKFCVGAVARGESGGFYMGANMEFPGEPLSSSIHAEQSAVMHAWHKGEHRITHLAVNAPPCGLCRQFLMELQGAESLKILLPGEAPRTLSEFLPRAFGPGDLHKSVRLLDEETTLLSRKGLPSGDFLADAALKAAEKSYAPYSGGFAGVALELEGAGIVAGRYAENAAFNPSMSPLASAVTLMVLEGHENRRILRAVLVEAENVSISHRRACEGILASWAPGSELEYFSVSKKE